MLVKEFKYVGFKLIAFQDGTAINIIQFDRNPKIIKDPIYSYKQQILSPGNKITGLICNKTSAGFGTLRLIDNYLIYLGKVILPADTLVLFRRRERKKIYFGYIELEKANDLFQPRALFYLNYAGSGRVIELNEILFYDL